MPSELEVEKGIGRGAREREARQDEKQQCPVACPVAAQHPPPQARPPSSTAVATIVSRSDPAASGKVPHDARLGAERGAVHLLRGLQVGGAKQDPPCEHRHQGRRDR